MKERVRHPRELSEVSASWFVIPAALWSVFVVAALVSAPPHEVAGPQSARAPSHEVAVTVEGA